MTRHGTVWTPSGVDLIDSYPRESHESSRVPTPKDSRCKVDETEWIGVPERTLPGSDHPDDQVGPD